MKTTRTRRLAIAATTVVASGLAVFAAAPAHAEPAWEDVQTVTEFGEHPYQLETVVNEKGKAVAIWVEHFGEQNVARVRASFRQPGGEWSTPKFLTPEAAHLLDTFEVAINDKGQAVATWIRNVDGSNRVQIRQLSAANVWGKVRSVSPSGRNGGSQAVDVAPNGDALVAWAAFGPREVRLTRVKTDGSKKAWTLSTRRGEELDLDTNRTGETVVVWSEHQDGRTPVRSRRLMNGKLTKKATLAPDGYAASVSLNDGGDAVAAYLRSNADYESRVVTNSGVSGGTWGPRVTLSTPGTNVMRPDTAIAFDGSQAIVWDNELNHIQATFRDLGEAWPASSMIGSGAQTYGAEVVMNDAGDLAVGWSNAEPSVRMLVKPAGEIGFFAPPLESDFVVNGLTAFGIDGDGSVVAIHGVQLGESYRLLSRFFNVLL